MDKGYEENFKPHTTDKEKAKFGLRQDILDKTVCWSLREICLSLIRKPTWFRSHTP
jgi:hypothetical protein